MGRSENRYVAERGREKITSAAKFDNNWFGANIVLSVRKSEKTGAKAVKNTEKSNAM